MNILLFPTRFFPAISGGDFFLQRIGEEFRKKQLKWTDGRISSTIITSDALDFAAVRGLGKSISFNDGEFVEYRGLTIKRYKVAPMQQKDENIFHEINQMGKYDEIEQFLLLCKSTLDFDDDSLQYFVKMGPILPKLTKELRNSNFHLQFGKNFDIIHCSYLPYANLVYALIIGKKYNIPVCVTPFLHPYNVRYDSKAIFQILSHFDKIFACTPSEKEIMAYNGIEIDKIEVVPMGVDWSKFTEKSYSHLISEIYSVEKPIVLFCGYKNYEKGALTLLKAIPLVLKSDPNIVFMFIGPSTTSFNYTLSAIKKEVPNAQIINLTPDNLNGVFDKKKIAAFQSAAIYCMPSRSDAYGIAYLEAWASKVPVIAAKNSAMEQVVQNGEDGLLVEFDNINAIATAIIYLSTHSQERITMGEKGFEKVIKKHGWDLITDIIVQHYKKLIG